MFAAAASDRAALSTPQAILPCWCEAAIAADMTASCVKRPWLAATRSLETTTGATRRTLPMRCRGSAFLRRSPATGDREDSAKNAQASLTGVGGGAL